MFSRIIQVASLALGLLVLGTYATNLLTGAEELTLSGVLFVVGFGCLFAGYGLVGLKTSRSPKAEVEVPFLLTHMAFDVQSRTGQGVVEWQLVESGHPLSPTEQQIALASLQYGRILQSHEPTRADLFSRMDRYAQDLVEGRAAKLDTWCLDTEAGPMQLWPWVLRGEPAEIGKAKVYKTRLDTVSDKRFAIRLKMALGLEKVLAPSAALMPIADLANRLDAGDRALLGSVIRHMHEHAGGPDGFRKLGVEAKAFNEALSVLRMGEGSRSSAVAPQAVAVAEHDETDLALQAFRFAEQHPLYEEDNLWSEQALLFAGYRRLSTMSEPEIHGLMYMSNRMMMRTELSLILKMLERVTDDEALSGEARGILDDQMLPRFARLTSIMTYHHLQSDAGDNEKGATMEEAEKAAKMFGGIPELSKAIAAYKQIFAIVQQQVELNPQNA